MQRFAFTSRLRLAQKVSRAHQIVLQSTTMATASDAGADSARSPLWTPVKIGEVQLSHRIAMSPMTRLRMTPGSELPNDLVATYYEQRASKGGLIITECAYVVPEGRGYVRAPGMATDPQAAAWRPVVERVHAKGGHIYMQLFHAGRVSHSSLVGKQLPVSASPVGMAGQLYVEGGVKQDYEVPRELTTAEVEALPSKFAEAAVRAVKLGGFDGVELHAGNGYLLQSFLAKKTNLRTDKYGGSIANRSRLLLEAIDAVAAALGPQRTAVKLQPGVTFSDLIEPEEDVRETLDYLGPELSKRKLAFVTLSSLNGEPYYKFAGLQAPNVNFDVFRDFRSKYSGTLAINGGLGIEQGEQYVTDGVADVVLYGVHFIANANLPELVAGGVKTGGLNMGSYNAKVWYSKDPAEDAVGFTDWPLVQPPSSSPSA
ncbi:hypothetical protein VOLCADRAFT_106009 [Volvox carteri f. nagariensis]|uniref:NADH:flavin oxidoreductase/NADH oxidase N-terminal domain-containing protein n=1 Tax=Volvox carteri f. nagariensis TaxID=3068 RepID=D8U4J0_VOLCA|nr:uncharacterized protein VOLCADRAFT_106009 [Volvox carteri f. nagariensis]EFJ45200.1 hypothetical protein VOLCADRAFT_106009 [Volvox carteri f. nagariensis]|eukprot:XP_002953576.1 hypothetical protein VOLCADRAFT_106009 [Volvox carteri f. nagariensis]